jgi:hypothetical protein
VAGKLATTCFLAPRRATGPAVVRISVAPGSRNRATGPAWPWLAVTRKWRAEPAAGHSRHAWGFAIATSSRIRTHGRGVIGRLRCWRRPGQSAKRGAAQRETRLVRLKFQQVLAMGVAVHERVKRGPAYRDVGYLAAIEANANRRASGAAATK